MLSRITNYLGSLLPALLFEFIQRAVVQFTEASK